MTATETSVVNRMDVRVSRTALLAALNLCSRAAGPRTAMAILGCVKLEAKGDSALSLTATNLEVTIETTIAAEIDQPGGTAIDVKALQDAVRHADGESVQLADREAGKDWISVRCGSAGFRMPTFRMQDFPFTPKLEPDAPSVRIAGELLTAAVRATSYAITQQPGRLDVNGVLLDVRKKGVEFCATDGNRMALIKVHDAKSGGKEFAVVIPHGALQILSQFDEGVPTISLGQHLTVAAGETRVFARTANHRFPNYREVVQKLKHEARADRAELLAIVKSVTPFSNQASRAVRFEFGPGKLSVGAINTERGSAANSMAIDYDGPTVVVGLQAHFATQALEAVETDAVSVRFLDGNGQVHFLPDAQPDDPTEALHVAMPMRIEWGAPNV